MAAPPPARALTKILVEEHGLFRRALVLFGCYAELVASGRRYDPRLARAFLRFFRIFGEKRHHECEERILFPWMAANGLHQGSGALLVLKSEHDLGRDLQEDLARTVRKLLESPGDQRLRLRFHGLALRYAELFTAHMAKEERVLFPLVRKIAARKAELHRAGGLPAHAQSWVERLEVGRADAWPRPALTLHGQGTLKGFERLCRQSLASANGAGSTAAPTPVRRVVPARRRRKAQRGRVARRTRTGK